VKLQPQSFSVVSVLTLLVAFCAPSPACLAQNGEPTEADITSVTAWLLDREQFLQLPFDNRISSQCLDRYLDTLDGIICCSFNPTWTNLRASVRGWL